MLNTSFRVGSNLASIPHLNIHPTEDWQRHIFIEIQNKYKPEVRDMQKVRNDALKLDKDPRKRDSHLRMYDDALDGVRVRIEEDYHNQVQNALGANDDLPLSFEEKQRCIYECQQQMPSRSTSGWASPIASEASDPADGPIPYDSDDAASSNDHIPLPNSGSNEHPPPQTGSPMPKKNVEGDGRRQEEPPSKLTDVELLIQECQSKLEQLKRSKENILKDTAPREVEIKALEETVAKREELKRRAMPREESAQRPPAEDAHTQEQSKEKSKAKTVTAWGLQKAEIPRTDGRDARPRAVEFIEDRRLKEFQRSQQQAAAVMDKLQRTKAKQESSIHEQVSTPSSRSTPSLQPPSTLPIPCNDSPTIVKSLEFQHQQEQRVKPPSSTSTSSAPKKKQRRPPVTIEEVSDPDTPGGKSNVHKPPANEPSAKSAQTLAKEEKKQAEEWRLAEEQRNEADRRLAGELQAAKMLPREIDLAGVVDDRDLPIALKKLAGDDEMWAKFLREQEKAAQSCQELDKAKSSQQGSRPVDVDGKQMLPASSFQERQRTSPTSPTSVNGNGRVSSRTTSSQRPILRYGKEKPGNTEGKRKLKGKQRANVVDVDEAVVVGAVTSGFAEFRAAKNNRQSMADNFCGKLRGMLVQDG